MLWVILAGIGKEILDGVSGLGIPDIWDIATTIIGGLIMWLITGII